VREQTKSVRLLPDDGGSLTISPNGSDSGQGITLVAQDADLEDAPRAVMLKLDPDTTDALVAAIYEAQGKRYRPGRTNGPTQGQP
jgi:hypothetical protein